MSAKAEEIQAAVSELAHAMARLVRALDALGDDGEAAGNVSEEMVRAIEGLAARLGAAGGFHS
jgi:outer membrane murein-binding lipoprotein Lpp